jgi:hypothetical protein
MQKRSLYQCSNARVKEGRIYCARGIPLPGSGGIIHIRSLISGKPLEFGVCQQCESYDEMGPPVPVDDRGWRAKR